LSAFAIARVVSPASASGITTYVSANEAATARLALARAGLPGLTAVPGKITAATQSLPPLAGDTGPPLAGLRVSGGSFSESGPNHRALREVVSSPIRVNAPSSLSSRSNVCRRAKLRIALLSPAEVRTHVFFKINQRSALHADGRVAVFARAPGNSFRASDRSARTWTNIVLGVLAVAFVVFLAVALFNFFEAPHAICEARTAGSRRAYRLPPSVPRRSAYPLGLPRPTEAPLRLGLDFGLERARIALDVMPAPRNDWRSPGNGTAWR
jgi:hypothetical protein